MRHNNGTGTLFYNFSTRDNKVSHMATKWITLFYLPIFPLERLSITRTITQPNEFRYIINEKYPLKPKDYLFTYFWGWIIIPFLLSFPIFLFPNDLTSSLGFPNFNLKILYWKGYNSLIFFYILYLIIFIWILMDWNEKRALPKNYKELLKLSSAKKNKGLNHFF